MTTVAGSAMMKSSEIYAFTTTQPRLLIKPLSDYQGPNNRPNNTYQCYKNKPNNFIQPITFHESQLFNTNNAKPTQNTFIIIKEPYIYETFYLFILYFLFRSLVHSQPKTLCLLFTQYIVHSPTPTADLLCSQAQSVVGSHKIFIVLRNVFFYKKY